MGLESPGASRSAENSRLLLRQERQPCVNRRIQIWSCGGGVQSAAVAALIVQGRLPRPDLAVIADTEREKSTTWSYLAQTIQPALDAMGLPVHRVKKSRYATVDLYSGNGDLLIPAFTRTNGELGKLETYCSNEWKQRVVRRWATQAHGVDLADLWIGFSTDELRRVRANRERKWQYRYPLIELQMTRQNCISLVTEMGWPEPPRSSCWMCPQMNHLEWQDLRDHNPQDFAKAVAFDKKLRERDPGVFVHRSGTPLDEADLDYDDPGERGLFACLGGCFT